MSLHVCMVVWWECCRSVSNWYPVGLLKRPTVHKDSCPVRGLKSCLTSTYRDLCLQVMARFDEITQNIIVKIVIPTKWHSIWHSFRHSIWRTFYLTFFLAYALTADILSLILSGIFSHILSGILSCTLSDIYSDFFLWHANVCSDILSGNFSGIYFFLAICLAFSNILSGILSDMFIICSNILSSSLSGTYSDILCSGPGVAHCIQSATWLGSVDAHSHDELAEEETKRRSEYSRSA